MGLFGKKKFKQVEYPKQEIPVPIPQPIQMQPVQQQSNKATIISTHLLENGKIRTILEGDEIGKVGEEFEYK